ncbi:MAG: phosphodiester glycosidase family protein, partial [Gemmatimonadaceae bacterium]
FYRAQGPWAIHVLEVDLARCWTPIALKAGAAAVGRATTAALVRALADSLALAGTATGAALAPNDSIPRVLGGVNADFFSFAPPGVPTGAHVHEGRVITGPGDRPVFAVDSAGRPWIGILRVDGRLVIPADSLGGGDVAPAGDEPASADTIRVEAWNRGASSGVALFDRAWGGRTDSARGAVEVAVGGDGRVVAVDTLPAGVAIPEGGWIIVAAAAAARREVERLRALRPGVRVGARTRLAPFHPRDAVGGFPVLLRDGRPPVKLEEQGGPRFGPVRHPRTAVAVGDSGRRLLLVTVDGRQPGYSAGMTLPELASLLRELGAHDALNLDGGGSTTLVVADDAGALHVANRPSDGTGERAVANVLAVVRDAACRVPS